MWEALNPNRKILKIKLFKIFLFIFRLSSFRSIRFTLLFSPGTAIVRIFISRAINPKMLRNNSVPMTGWVKYRQKISCRAPGRCEEFAWPPPVVLQILHTWQAPLLSWSASMANLIKASRARELASTTDLFFFLPVGMMFTCKGEVS